MTTQAYQYWYCCGKKIRDVGPFESHNAAITAAFSAHPNAKSCMTGYGTMGAFADIRWTSNPNYKP